MYTKTKWKLGRERQQKREKKVEQNVCNTHYQREMGWDRTMIKRPNKNPHFY